MASVSEVDAQTSGLPVEEPHDARSDRITHKTIHKFDDISLLYAFEEPDLAFQILKELRCQLTPDNCLDSHKSCGVCCLDGEEKQP